MLIIDAHGESGLLHVTWLVVPLLSTVLLVQLLAQLAPHVGLMDQPTARKAHGESVPMVGGLAIFIILVTVSVTQNQFTWLMVCAGLLVVIGAIDDIRHLGVRARLVTQIGCTVLMLLGSGVQIDSLGVYGGIEVYLGWFAPIFTIFAVVGITNAFNMLDGLDGLCSGHGLVAVISFFVASWIHGALISVEWLIALIASLLGFWLVNMRATPIRRVFLGDAGSTFIGFVLAWLAIGYTQAPWNVLHPVIALWCLAIPVFDTCVVVLRRIRIGRSPFAPDRLHLHHRLVDSGLNPRSAVFLMLIVSAVTNALGLVIFWATSSPQLAIALYCAAFALFMYASLHPAIERRLIARSRLLMARRW